MNERHSLEQRIAENSVAFLHNHTGISLETVEINSLLGTGLWPDMKFRIASTELELISEVKTGVTRDNIRPMIKQLLVASDGRIPLFIADTISTEVGIVLREAKINYLDSGGNTYLNIPPLFIFIDSQPINKNIPRSRPARPFSATDLQVIFALLTNPELLNANYRRISEYANVALGICGSVFRELKDQGFFVESRRTKIREWSARHKLMGRWVEQYSTLRNKVFLGQYSPVDSDWWQCQEFKKYDAHLGGDFAAEDYTSNAIDAEHKLYIGDQQQWKFIREMSFNKLEPADSVPSSKVNVYSKFWGKTAADESRPQITHPLITYADLIDAGDKDSREAANIIAERYFV